VSVFQLIVTSIAFSVSHPFRKPMYTNWLFVFFIFANTFFAFYFINLNEHQWVADVFFLMNIPGYFRHWLLLIVFGNCLITYLFEKVIVYFISVWDQGRLERKRLANINFEVDKSRSEIDLFFALKQQKDEGGVEITDSYNKQPKQQNTARNVVHAEDDEQPLGNLDEKVKAAILKV